MDYSDLKDYFDKFVKNFSPFKNEKTYQSIISVLTNNYFSDSYETIPEYIKTLIENKTILPGLYNSLMSNVGYPSNLISNLRTTQKSAIVENLMDYNRYKGTQFFFKKVGELFNESFSFYELYIDYRAVSKSEKDWVFVPRPIYLYDKTTLPILNFDDTVADIPTYFINKSILEISRQSKSIVLPIKTNLVYLDMHTTMYSSTLTDLISTTAMYAFKDIYFALYLEDNYFNITIGSAYILWFYLLYKYSNTVYSPTFSTSDVTILYYYFGGASFPYTLQGDGQNSITTIIEAYKNLSLNQDDITAFRKTYLDDPFKSALATQQFTFDMYRRRALTTVGSDLITYVDDFIENYNDKKSLAILTLLGSITDSLRSSISTTSNTLLQQYSEYIFRMFPTMLYDPKTTGTYLLLNEFKPLHTELVDKSKYYVVTQDIVDGDVSYDKFNTIIPGDKGTSITITVDYCTAAVLSRDYYFSVSVETGFFSFSNTNKVITDYKGAQKFNIGEYIYSRDINTNIFPTDTAVKITNIQPTDPLVDGSFFDIELSEWTTRFSHLDNLQPAFSSEYQVWSYDDSQNIVNCNSETISFVGIISNFITHAYSHEVTLKSSDYDDGIIGVILAYSVDTSNIEHTLSAIRTPTSNNGIPQWCVVYDYKKSTQQVISTGIISNVNDKWVNFPIGTTVKIERNDDVIILLTTPFNSTYIDYTSKITVDLTSNSVLSQFRTAKQIGYCAFSQKANFSNIKILSGNYNLILESVYYGLTGVFPRAYRKWPSGIDDIITLGDEGFYSFSTSAESKDVGTNEYGFTKFSVGDWIYSPDDSKEFAVQIVSKDSNTYTFRLLTSYQGTAGVWNSAYIWRPAP